VLLDGRDIRDFRQASYRALFGVVTQETVLFHDSVRSNIAYGMSPEAVTDEEIVAAAEIANAHEFIAELPESYATVVGDRGLRLSGGQRQRLAIARAVLRNPTILIFDEATSSLDSESELLVQEAIERLLTGRTAIVIAHRLSTIRNADRIVVLEDGRIVEAGTHDELLTRDGTYRRLYETQYDQTAPLPEVSSA
jgi:subfamily B ATP-binding cassette protein MsbA